MKVLIAAYACEPNRGSEPGVGWNWVQAASRAHEVWVITRANNRPSIEAALEADSSVSFVYIDLPAWVRRWKRGARGVRVYYTVWQILVAREARRLHRQERFDVVHHLTFANMRLPALACLAGAPFVLGPVAGGQRVPLALYRALGAAGVATEILLLGLRFLNSLNPVVRVAWKRASVILVNNEETRLALPQSCRQKAFVRPNASVERLAPMEPRPPSGSQFLAMCAGRLNRFKGISIAIRAVGLAPGWRLLVVGDGPERERLEQIARSAGVASRIEFVPTLPQAELWRRLASCQALLLPSLKEGASFIAAEAYTLGIPVVAFDANGPAALERFAGSGFELVTAQRPAEAARAFAAALARVRRAPVTSRGSVFGLDAVARDLDVVYLAALASGTEELSEAHA